MALNKIGLHFPGNSMEAVHVGSGVGHGNLDDMEYEVWKDADGDLIVGASHVDVGQVTWYWADQSDVDSILADTFGYDVHVCETCGLEMVVEDGEEPYCPKEH